MAHSREVELDLLCHKRLDAGMKTRRIIGKIMDANPEDSEKLLSLCLELRVAAREELEAKNAYHEALGFI